MSDLIIVNARVTTLDPRKPQAQAVAIRDGVFLVVGTEAEVRAAAAPDAKVIDAKLRRLIPGLIDSHIHVIRGGLNYNMELRWDGVPSLLSALNPLLSSHTNSEAAGTAALALVKLLGTRLAALMDDPEIAKLEILRANDGSGNAQLVSLVDLAAAAHDRRLFRDNPNVQRMLKSLHDAAPGCGVLTVGGDAAALLAEIGAPFAFADASKESFARLILRAANFGSVEARAKYMSDHFSLAPEVRSAFRRMAAGRDCGDSAKLVALPQGMGPLSDLATKLIAQENGSFLISHEIVDVLKAGERRHLGIHEIDGLALGLLLRNNAAVLGDQTVGRDLIVALLRSDIPDGDLLVLPIFPATNGDLHCAAQVWRETKQFSVPKILTPVVPILQKLQDPLADERMNRMVGVWSPEAQISVALSQSAPENFTGEILDALNKVESTLPERSRTVEWLTDRQGRNWAPEDVLDLPKGVLCAARKLYGLEADAAFVPVDELTEELSTEKALGAMRRNRILPDLAGSIERLLMLIEDNSPVAWAGGTGSGVADNLLQLARSGADLCLPGWPLLSELLRMPEMLPERILPAFGTIQPDDGDHALAWMTSLADLAKAGNGPAWEIYCASFETFCAWPNKASKPLFRDIPVPTEAETWRPGRKVARGGNGLAKTHLLHRSLRSKLPRRTDVLASVSEDSQAPHGQPFISIDPVRMERQSAESLRSILEYARPHVPADLLVLLVRLVGQSDPFRVVAKDVLAVSEADIARIWSRFDSEVVLHFKPQKLGETLAEKRKSRFINFVSVCNSPTTEIAETLDGEIKDFPVGDIQPLGIIGDIHIGWQNIWQGKNLIGVRDLQIVTVADQVVKPEQVKALCLTLATVLIGYRKEQPGCHESLGGLADACNRIDQSTVDSARAELEDRLPQVLDELKPKQGSGMWNARKTYRAAVDSIPFGEQREKSRPGAKRTLWQAVCKTEVQKEMLGAIRSRIDDFGYRPTRILFELFQNADDATQQHPGTGPGRFSVAFVDGRLVTRHWGRLINHPGPDPQEGVRQGWRSDLFNMLVMNLSEKREDVTGRFGLGFKSVHLIADEVGIASHFVACKVRGGMLPDIWDAGRQVSVESSVDGRPATVIDLHIDPDRHPHAIEAVSAFRAVSGWLPAMSRSIRCIEIEGQGRWLADSPISLNDGVSLVKFAGREPGYALALDLGQETTIFLPLGAHGPVPADEKLPRLWLLAPLDETLTSGWLLNSRQFPVDPGRGRLKGSAEALQSMFARFGVVLGQRLVSLNDMVARDWQSFSVAAGIGNLDAETGYAGFLRTLCDLFERDFADPLACHLHGNDRGLGRLFSERPSLATGLPLPFDPFLQVGSVKLELKGALADRKVLVALKDWQMIQTVGKCSVGTEAAQRLERLGFARPKPFGFVDALRHEVGPDKRITPELADRLGAVLTDDLLTEIEKDEESAILELLSTSLFQLADGTWRTAALPPSQAKDSDEEERLLLAFAPEKCRAANNYDGKGLAIYRLSMRQSGFQRSASDFAKWAESMDNGVQQRALLHYVLEGRQGATLGSILAKKRPFWIHAQSDEMRVSPIVADISDDEMPKLLGLLYPEEQRLRWSEDFGTVAPLDANQPFDLEVADAERFLKRLHGWWERDHKAERNRYEQTAYPDGFHPRSLFGKDAEAEREAWFAASSIAAITRALTRRRDMLTRTILGGLPADTAEAETMDEAAEAEESRPSEVTVLLMKDEIARLDEIIGYANEIEEETKVATLIKLIEARLEPEEPLLLFTEYKATQALVLSKLEARFGKGCAGFINGDERLAVHDQERRERTITLSRDAAAADFNAGRTRFLISTEAGGEGIDLQERCAKLVHVDLPWNPMRLHQRVGRLSRYGQKRAVQVYLLRNPQTVEARIWALLEEKLSRIQATLSASMEEPEDISQLVIGMAGSNFFDGLFSEGATSSTDRLAEWFDQSTQQFGGKDAVDTVRAMLGNVARYDFQTAGAEIPKLDLPALEPFFRQSMLLAGRRVTKPEAGLSVATPESWRGSVELRDRYDGLSFNRFLPADQALVRLLGVGHPLMDRALQENADQQVFLTRVKGIDAPILIALVEDEVTGTGATVHRVILGVEGLYEGNPVVLRDWELLLRLNAIEPLSEYAEGPSSVEAAAIGAAGAKLAEHVGLLDLSFRLPKAKPILVLLPEGQ